MYKKLAYLVAFLTSLNGLAMQQGSSSNDDPNVQLLSQYQNDYAQYSTHSIIPIDDLKPDENQKPTLAPAFLLPADDLKDFAHKNNYFPFFCSDEIGTLHAALVPTTLIKQESDFNIDTICQHFDPYSTTSVKLEPWETTKALKLVTIGLLYAINNKNQWKALKKTSTIPPTKKDIKGALKFTRKYMFKEKSDTVTLLNRAAILGGYKKLIKKKNVLSEIMEGALGKPHTKHFMPSDSSTPSGYYYFHFKNNIIAITYHSYLNNANIYTFKLNLHSKTISNIAKWNHPDCKIKILKLLDDAIIIDKLNYTNKYCDDGHTIEIWDLNNTRQLVIPTQSKGCSDAALNPKKTTLAIANDRTYLVNSRFIIKSTIELLNAKTGQSIRHYPLYKENKSLGATGFTKHIEWNSQNNITILNHETLRSLNLKSGKTTTVIHQNYRRPIEYFAWNSKNTILATLRSNSNLSEKQHKLVLHDSCGKRIQKSFYFKQKPDAIDWLNNHTVLTYSRSYRKVNSINTNRLILNNNSDQEVLKYRLKQECSE
jgi:hypothetical protein